MWARPGLHRVHPEPPVMSCLQSTVASLATYAFGHKISHLGSSNKLPDTLQFLSDMLSLTISA
jgi:hypothetical protein